MKKVIFVLPLFAVLALFSCSKEEMVQAEQQITVQPLKSGTTALGYPEIRDSRLYFDDFSAFEQFMAAFATQQPDYLEGNHQSSGFIPLSQVIDMGDSLILPSSMNNDTTTHIEDPYLLEVLNHNQEVAIGELICRVEADFVYIYVNGHFDEVAGFKRTAQGNGMELNEVKLINDKLVAFKLEVERSNRFWIAGHGNRTSTSIRTLGSRNRLVARHWQTNLMFYKSAGMRTIHERRRNNGNWRKSKADKIRCRGHVDVEVNPYNSGWVNRSEAFDEERSNKKQVAYAIFTVVGINVKVTANSIKGINAPDKTKFKISNLTVSHHRVEESGGVVTRPNKTWIW